MIRKALYKCSPFTESVTQTDQTPDYCKMATLAMRTKLTLRTKVEMDKTKTQFTQRAKEGMKGSITQAPGK